MKSVKQSTPRPVEGWKPSRITAHPGAVLLENYLRPLGMNVHRLSVLLKMPPSRMNDVVRGRRGITVDTAFRLARLFGNTAAYWLELQTAHDLSLARHTGVERKAKLDIKPLGREDRSKIRAAS